MAGHDRLPYVDRMADIDTRKLRVLCEFDARGTITEAGAALHLTPSAVSQQIASLGREVGVLLTEPDGRRVRLTGAGKVLVEHGRDILAELERVRVSLASYASGGRGELRVADSTLTGIGVPLVVRLRRARPGLSVLLHELDAEEASVALARDDVDVAIGVVPNLEPVIDDGRFTARSLLVDHYDLALSAAHRLAGAATIRLADLAADEWVFPPLRLCRELGLLACRSAGFAPAVVHTVGDWAGTLAAVRSGLGVALVPRLALAARPGGIVTRSLAGQVEEYHVIAMVRRGSEDSPQIAAALDTLSEILAEEAAKPVPEVVALTGPARIAGLWISLLSVLERSGGVICGQSS